MLLCLAIVLVLGSAALVPALKTSEPQDPGNNDSPPPAPAAKDNAATKPSLERLIGSRILPGFGALLVLLGFGYLLDYSIERDWLKPPLRVAFGLAASLSIVGLAQIPRVSRLGVWSDLLAALGFGGAYVSLWYAGESQAGVISSSMTLLGGHALTALALGCGLARDRALLVSAALVAGFFVPQLLGYDQTSFLGYFGHGLALAGAALIAALIRDHRGPRLVACVGLAVLAFTWAETRDFVSHTPDLVLMSWVLLAFGLIGGIGPALLRGRQDIEDQTTLVAGLLALAGGLSFAHEGWLLGSEFIIVAALCGVSAIWLSRRSDAEGTAELRDHLMLATVAFASAAPAAVFGLDPILGPVWCLEGAAILALANRLGRVSFMARFVSFAMVACGAFSLLLEIGNDDAPFTIFRLGAWIIAALGATIASELAWRSAGRNESLDSIAHLLFTAVLGSGASVLYAAEGAFARDWTPMGTIFVGLGGVLAMLLGLALRGRHVGRPLALYSGPILYLPLSALALITLATAPLPADMSLLIPIAGSFFVAISGYAFVRLIEEANAPTGLCEIGLVTPVLFTMVAGHILLARIGTHLPIEPACLVPVWWGLGLVASALYHQKRPGWASLTSFLTITAGGLVSYALVVTDARSSAALFCDPKFLGLLTWCAALTFTATRLLEGRLKSGLALTSQALLALLALIEIRSWAAFSDPQFLGLGTVSPLVAEGVISAVWGLHATLLITIGLQRQRPAWRIAGLALFLFTAVKVILFDLALADTLTRVIAALVVGSAMLGASLLYARRDQKELTS